MLPRGGGLDGVPGVPGQRRRRGGGARPRLGRGVDARAARRRHSPHRRPRALRRYRALVGPLGEEIVWRRGAGGAQVPRSRLALLRVQHRLRPGPLGAAVRGRAAEAVDVGRRRLRRRLAAPRSHGGHDAHVRRGHRALPAPGPRRADGRAHEGLPDHAHAPRRDAGAPRLHLVHAVLPRRLLRHHDPRLLGHLPRVRQVHELRQASAPRGLPRLHRPLRRLRGELLLSAAVDLPEAHRLAGHHPGVRYLRVLAGCLPRRLGLRRQVLPHHRLLLHPDGAAGDLGLCHRQAALQDRRARRGGGGHPRDGSAGG
mmetsp:Transcript_43872/g.137869  ORF Transcript_43872/g.137869 Transcript_43872/m.137869 type:complete len:313 (-) Transcript_43872:1050-1988(-)